MILTLPYFRGMLCQGAEVWTIFFLFFIHHNSDTIHNKYAWNKIICKYINL